MRGHSLPGLGWSPAAPWGQQAAASGPGRSPLLGDASLLPTSNKTGIPQTFCTLWVDKGTHKSSPAAAGSGTAVAVTMSQARFAFCHLGSPVAVTQPLAWRACRGTCQVPTQPAWAGRSTQLTWEHHPSLAQDQGLEKQKAWPSLGTSKWKPAQPWASRNGLKSY